MQLKINGTEIEQEKKSKFPWKKRITRKNN